MQEDNIIEADAYLDITVKEQQNEEGQHFPSKDMENKHLPLNKPMHEKTRRLRQLSLVETCNALRTAQIKRKTCHAIE